jgi:hypothetical protein
MGIGSFANSVLTVLKINKKIKKLIVPSKMIS